MNCQLYVVFFHLLLDIGEEDYSRRTTIIFTPAIFAYSKAYLQLPQFSL